jgi:hypothetical protein
VDKCLETQGVRTTIGWSGNNSTAINIYYR